MKMPEAFRYKKRIVHLLYTLSHCAEPQQEIIQQLAIPADQILRTWVAKRTLNTFTVKITVNYQDF